jgi:hypothetical protein
VASMTKRRTRYSLPVLLMFGCLLLPLLGCESAAAKCQKAQKASEAAWGGYADALQQATKAAHNAQSEAQHALTGTVEHRLTPGAQKAADARYPRSSEAWLLAYRSAYEDACEKDDECNRLRQQSSDAKIAIEDLSDRLPHAQAAHAAAVAPAEQAREAAKAVVGHPEFPEYQSAQTLSIAAYKACKDLASGTAP